MTPSVDGYGAAASSKSSGAGVDAPDERCSPVEADGAAGARPLHEIVREGISLIRAASSRNLMISLVLRLVSGGGIALFLLLAGNLMREVGDSTDVQSVLPSFLGAVVVLMGLVIATTWGREVEDLLAEETARYARTKIAAVASTVELRAYDAAPFHDHLKRSIEGGALRPLQLVRGLVGLVGSIIGIIGVLVALFATQPLLVPVAAGAAIPLWVASGRVGRIYFGFACDVTPLQRRRDYVYRLLTERDAAKELRAYGLGAFLRRQHDELYGAHFRELRMMIRRRTRVALAAGVLMSALIAAVTAIMLFLVEQGQIRLADAGISVAGVMILGERLVNAAVSATELYESSPFVGDFLSFLALESPARRTGAPSRPKSGEGLRATNVSFTYPGASRPALDGASIRVRPGEVVALVGKNGSGKSTLAKLICGLYQPDSGEISWNGADLALPSQDDNPDVAVLFQDFLRYLFPARTNIGLGRTSSIEDLDAIVAAAKRASAHDFLQRLPQGYETVLGTEFEGGTDLSLGQWQRVALARAFLRDASLVVLDEPTSSLDASAEHALFETMRELAENRAVLLISHRFSTVRTADAVYVLNGGRIVEHGSHQELLDRGGEYAEMFMLQASSFVDVDRAG